MSESEEFTLYIGNRNYSSWSLRSALLMRVAGIPCREVLIPLDTSETAAAIRKVSPGATVPVLHHGSNVIWDTLAIAEYLADIFPEKRLWPADLRARSQARSISAEMHSAFAALRRELPMNLRKRFEDFEVPEAAAEDIRRINEIWRQCRKDFGAGGSFLFGDFTITDAFYAPVASRFRAYGLDLDKVTEDYVAAIHALPAFEKWLEEARLEPWILEADEIRLPTS